METKIEIRTNEKNCYIEEVGTGKFFEHKGEHYIKVDARVIGVNLLNGYVTAFPEHCIVRMADSTRWVKK